MGNIWRPTFSLDLARTVLPGLQAQLDHLFQQTIAVTGKPLDHIYSRMSFFNGEFFPQGWGNLGVVNLEDDLKFMQHWPPPGIKLDWKQIDSGMWEDLPYKLYEARFKTPCVSRVYDALPEESRVARVQFLVPAARPLPGAAWPGSPAIAPVQGYPPAPSGVVHLAGTGDQGFSRRLRLAMPLIKKGSCAMVHESPFYGARRPAAQKGSKLLKVSDLLALGWATIYESLNLLHWMDREGYSEGGLGMAGLSMGGVHACMTSALYPGPVATAALLAPRSAAVAYCDGALSAAMAWQPLLKEVDDADANVFKVIRTAAQPVALMREATYALQELELAFEEAAALAPLQDVVQQTQPGARCSVEAGVAGTAAPLSSVQPAPEQQQHRGSAASAVLQAAAKHQQQQQLELQQRQAGAAPGVLEPATATVQAVTEAAQWLRDGGLQKALLAQHTASGTGAGAGSAEAGSGQQDERVPAVPGGQRDPPLAQVTGGLAAVPHQARVHHHGRQHHATHASSAEAPAAVSAAVPAASAVALTVPEMKQMALTLSRLILGLAELKSLAVADVSMHRRKTLRRLKHVLETYTDITRFPTPRRPDAGVFVAATHDAYVSVESVRQLSERWPGSEMRLVSGGHVTAYLMHHDKFREAILDSLDRLKRPPQHLPAGPVRPGSPSSL